MFCKFKKRTVSQERVVVAEQPGSIQRRVYAAEQRAQGSAAAGAVHLVLQYIPPRHSLCTLRSSVASHARLITPFLAHH